MNIPIYLTNFQCFQLRVRFKAMLEVEMKKIWYFLPRYALGNALKNSGQYRALYHSLFRPSTDGKESGDDLNLTPLVIRADRPTRRSFRKYEFLDLYVTIVAKDPETVNEFIRFLPEWQYYDFFAEYHFKFERYQLLNPLTNLFENSLPAEKAILNYSYFNKIKPVWSESICVQFLSPATLYINNAFPQEILLDELFQRMSFRVAKLYRHFLAPEPNTVEIAPLTAEHSLLLSSLSLPQKVLFKGKKEYNLAGILGKIYYDVPFDETLSLLFAITSFVHVGQHAVSGNGQLKACKISLSWFKQYLEIILKAPVPDKCREDYLKAVVEVSKLNYRPGLYTQAFIPKSDGSYRELTIPDQTDLLLQRELAGLLYQKLGDQLLVQSYAYRKGQGTVQAIKQIQKWRKQFPDKVIIRCDIDRFFDTISLPLLLIKLEQYIVDPFIMHLVELWVKSGVLTSQNDYLPNEEGIPQGSPLSPVLSNLFLHELDLMIKEKITPFFIRYADDICLIIDEDKSPISIIQMLTDFLNHNLRLKLNNEFFIGKPGDTFTFLGIEFLPGLQLGIADDKFYKIEEKINQVLKLESHNHEKLLQKIKGYQRYYGQLLNQERLKQIDNEIFRAYDNYLKTVSDKKTFELKSQLLQSINGIVSDYSPPEWNKNTVVSIDKPPVVLKSVKQMLRNQEQNHLKKYAQDYELVVIQSGAFIGIRKNWVSISYKGQIIDKKPIGYLKQISVMVPGVNVSGYLAKKCVEKNIHIIFYNNIGQPYAAVHQPQPYLTSVMRKQLDLNDKKRMLFISALVKNKLTNQLKLLKYFRKYYKKSESVANVLNNCVNKMEHLLKLPPQETDYHTLREKLFLWEAAVATHYWKGFRALVEKTGYQFEKREHQGATDIVNQMLNYGYAILESKVLRTLQTWQICPNISYLHSSSDNEPSLCFDLMEQYRAFVVDRSVLALISKKEKIEQGCDNLLDLPSRKKIIAKINERLFALQRVGSKTKTLDAAMHIQAGDTLDFIMGKKTKINFYTPQW